MKIIVGLGNPGKKYEKTWHNLGFLAADNLVNEFDFEKLKINKKLKAEIAKGRIGQKKIIIAKPQTFINNSGESVLWLIKYFKIKPSDLIVIHDDADLPLGKIRLVKDSSAGGHNGVKSIIDYLKTRDFVRIKIGVRTRKTEQVGVLDYVLEKFRRTEEKIINESIKKTVLAVKTAITGSLEKAMNNFN